ncbi:hypothetical protein [Adhaeribacter soli]|uniref:Uncharacterized protein n=1 Tax=Adhaeribacter soli TaxID=2607655 RepID=A0A5N1J5L9_9BACT|nr:hypothetical protein [Adhaeribacter soli]KAA9339992.1 hypothetical protein F0P94_06485 [Adhaeribacter soli]
MTWTEQDDRDMLYATNYLRANGLTLSADLKQQLSTLLRGVSINSIKAKYDNYSYLITGAEGLSNYSKQSERMYNLYGTSLDLIRPNVSAGVLDLLR